MKHSDFGYRIYALCIVFMTFGFNAPNTFIILFYLFDFPIF